MPECGKEFTPAYRNRRNAKFCSPRCRQRWHTLSTVQQSDYRKRGISSATVGALGELRAAADLLNRGYEVVRSLSPACSCDLVAFKDGKLLKIEVRTGRQCQHTGKVLYPTNRFRADHFAVILPDRVLYEPELDLTGA